MTDPGLNGSPQSLIESATTHAMRGLISPGDWLTGTERFAAWHEVRDARTNPLDAARRAALSPAMIDNEHASTDVLSAQAVEVLHRIASDPGRLTQEWANDMIAALGEEIYVELVGIAATSMVIDTFAVALGHDEPTISAAIGGDPARARPDDVGAVGAWVAQSTGDTMANVSRSLSLTPVQNEQWIGLVQAMYSRGRQFTQLEWERALSRPQVELVAARTTAELECFY